MNPDIKNTNVNNETSPAIAMPGRLEAAPSNRPEVEPISAIERDVQQAENVPPSGPSPMISLPTPVVTSTTGAATQGDDDLPTNKDEDLIEKVWVEKAKKIISQTKDDPYKREENVTDLKVNYLRKRFGRELSRPK